jgi:hypothetical protein
MWATAMTRISWLRGPEEGRLMAAKAKLNVMAAWCSLNPPPPLDLATIAGRKARVSVMQGQQQEAAVSGGPCPL